MNDVTIHEEAHGCAHCPARGHCLASDAGLAGCRRRLAQGEALFRRDQPFAFLYAVRTGRLKVARADDRGQQQVTAFPAAGDLLGLEAIGAGRHACSAVALAPSEVCEIPYAGLQAALLRAPRLMQRFHAAMSMEIAREGALLLQARLPAGVRLASLLLALSARQAQDGSPAAHLHLPMSRADIGNHLGLTIESVSRQLARLRKAGWIAVDGRDIVLLRRDRLEALLSTPGKHHSPA